MVLKRRAGVLMHPTSLPGAGGIGTLGQELHCFLDFLNQSGFSLWQVLPLTPPAAGNSPYSSYSAFAGNTFLIDIDMLIREGDLPADTPLGTFPADRVDFSALLPHKDKLLQQAAAIFFAAGQRHRLEEFWHFCDTTFWLHDYALYQALKQQYQGVAWSCWPRDIALREPAACEQASATLGPEIGVQKYLQWQFSKQWEQTRSFARSRGIEIIGDLPIFVAYDSADVWCNRHLFLLDSAGCPLEVAGVPPDYFSSTGQLWGNPLYDWEAMARDGYAWWIARFRQLLQQFDLVRIDHFRGFEAAWQVPATAKTAVDGRWVPGPGAAFFRVVQDALGDLPFVAEDLGVITPQVELLRDQFGMPGMKILQFAFDSDAANPYLPHNHIPHCVVYTGTHDNNTSEGWAAGLPAHVTRAMTDYLGVSGSDPAGDLIRTALMSVASTAILPMQDILGLPEEARMNLPGTAQGNWGWRMQKQALSDNLSQKWAQLLKRYGRYTSRSSSVKSCAGNQK